MKETSSMKETVCLQQSPIGSTFRDAVCDPQI